MWSGRAGRRRCCVGGVVSISQEVDSEPMPVLPACVLEATGVDGQGVRTLGGGQAGEAVDREHRAGEGLDGHRAGDQVGPAVVGQGQVGRREGGRVDRLGEGDVDRGHRGIPRVGSGRGDRGDRRRRRIDEEGDSRQRRGVPRDIFVGDLKLGRPQGQVECQGEGGACDHRRAQVGAGRRVEDVDRQARRGERAGERDGCRCRSGRA